MVNLITWGGSLLRLSCPSNLLSLKTYTLSIMRAMNLSRVLLSTKNLPSTNQSRPFLGVEIPSNANKLYPYPITREVARAERYFEALPEGVISMGRAGSYKYIDIDDIIDQAMDMARQIKDGGLTIRYPYMVSWLRAAKLEAESIQAN